MSRSRIGEPIEAKTVIDTWRTVEYVCGLCRMAADVLRAEREAERAKAKAERQAERKARADRARALRAALGIGL